MQIVCYFDGASKNNNDKSKKSVASIGYLIDFKNDKKSVKCCKPIDFKTNNEAEYESLVELLEHLLNLFNLRDDLNETTEILILGDSKLVIEQVNGNWKVKSANLKKLNLKAKQLKSELENKCFSLKIQWIPRDENLADSLANNCI